MNFKFKKITIDNFMSLEHAELDLDNRGTVFVKGSNLFEDTATSNGSGKSSIFEAIVWCLTGKTNKPAKSISNLNIKDSIASVTLEIDIDKDNYLITRTDNKSLTIVKNGNDISGNTFTKSKDILEKELGFVNELVISSIIILGQGMEHRFSKQKATERKATLEYLVGMDSLLENIGNILDSNDTKISEKITEINLKITEQNTIKSTSQQIIDSYNNRPSLSEKEYKENLKEFNRLADEGEALQKEIQENKDEINNILQEKDKINKELLEYTNKISVKNREIEGIINNKKVLENQLNELNSQLEEAKQKSCPLCHQHLEDTEIENKLNKDIDKINEELKQIKDTKKLEEEVKKLTDKNEKLKKETDEKQKEINQINATLTDKNKELVNITNEYNKYQDLLAQYDKYKAESNSIDQIIKDSNEKIKAADKELEILTNNLNKYNTDKDINKFFKNQVSRKFRNFLLEGVFIYLNERLKYYSSKLLTKHEIVLENDNSDIEIRIGNKYFGDLSGGEGRKIDMAIQCALRDLARNQRNLSVNLLVLDEVFDYLDSLGIETMIKFIDEEITDVNTKFITSHMKDLKIDYDEIIEVEKDVDEISRIK